jgi:1-acyl-sn-glycerol-3-phosphate acyltransferase
MTRTLAVARRLGRIVGAFVCVWVVARLVAPFLSSDRRRRLAAWLSSELLRVIGVRLDLRGGVPDGRPLLLVANHVSWLDVQILNAVCPSRFVAKAETRRWPVCGAIAAGFDTFFLERASLRDAARVKARVAAALAAGQSVAVFPEGTTTDGRTLGRFYAALFEAAIEAGVSVQPVAIRYPRADDSANPAAAFVDDMTFVDSLVRIAREPALSARLTFAAPIRARTMARRDLAALARRRIAEALGFPAIGPSSEHVARLPPPAWRTTGSRTPKTDRISLPALRRRPPRMPLVPPAAA